LSSGSDGERQTSFSIHGAIADLPAIFPFPSELDLGSGVVARKRSGVLRIWGDSGLLSQIPDEIEIESSRGSQIVLNFDKASHISRYREIKVTMPVDNEAITRSLVTFVDNARSTTISVPVMAIGLNPVVATPPSVLITTRSDEDAEGTFTLKSVGGLPLRISTIVTDLPLKINPPTAAASGEVVIRFSTERRESTGLLGTITVELSSPSERVKVPVVINALPL
jgi:hypothetical protein